MRARRSGRYDSFAKDDSVTLGLLLLFHGLARRHGGAVSIGDFIHELRTVHGLSPEHLAAVSSVFRLWKRRCYIEPGKGGMPRRPHYRVHNAGALILLTASQSAQADAQARMRSIRATSGPPTH